MKYLCLVYLNEKNWTPYPTASARPAATRCGKVATTLPPKRCSPFIRQRPCVSATGKCP
jgi:hypothetical protein